MIWSGRSASLVSSMTFLVAFLLGGATFPAAAVVPATSGPWAVSSSSDPDDESSSDSSELLSSIVADSSDFRAFVFSFFSIYSSNY